MSWFARKHGRSFAHKSTTLIAGWAEVECIAGWQNNSQHNYQKTQREQLGEIKCFKFVISTLLHILVIHFI